MPEGEYEAALRVLRESGVEFVVVGGLAAVLNGAPVNTFDLDIVPARDEENVARLLRALEALDAVYRMQPSRRRKPDASRLWQARRPLTDVRGSVRSACYRAATVRERHLPRAANHLRSRGPHNPITNCGPLDVLGTIGRGLAYEDLLPHSIKMETGGGVRVSVLDLETIVALKEQLAGEKDLAALPILRRTLEERQRQS